MACRQYDCKQSSGHKLVAGGIEAFDPNLFVITHDLKDIFNTPPFYRIIQKDIEKAFRFVVKGYRPIVLFGIEAAELLAPWIKDKGGMKAWRGHFWEGSWPWKEGVAEMGPAPTTFLAA
jgi:hypothetical protein